MLTRAVIQGFKCLRDVSAELGPFNVIIGPNDAGKSSFLQAVSLASRFNWGGTWSSPATIELVAGPATILFKPGKAVARIQVTDAAAFTATEPIMLDPAAIAALSPRGSGALDDLIRGRGRGTAAHLARVALGDRQRYEAIQKAMLEVTNGRVRQVVVGEEVGDKGYPLSFRLHDDTVVPAAQMSQGLLVYLAFLALIHRDDAPSILLLEEPENGLHPLRLFEVVTLLRSLTERGVQIILTTHSPDLLNACKPEEVLVFLRPDPDSGTEIHRLPADFERLAMGDTIGQIWASRGEQGLLDLLPKVAPRVRAEAT